MTTRNTRLKAASLWVLLAIFFSPFVLQAQSATGDIPRLPDGRPDLQGTWDFRTITPMQRPQSLADVDVLNETDAAVFEAAENVRRDRDNFTDTTTLFITYKEQMNSGRNVVKTGVILIGSVWIV